MKVGIDFESQMNKVSAISGATGADLETLKGKAKELGSQTKFSATEAAEGLEYFAMAGYSVEDSVNAIGPTLDLAIASGADLATTADIVSDSMTAFGLASSETAKFTDLLANVSRSANTNVNLLGESFQYVAPVASAMGYSAEDTAEALALMAQAGIKGSNAGTTLRSALTRLAKPTGEVQSLMKEMGLEMADAEGNMLPLDNVIGQLRNSFGDLSEEQQAQYATTLFGKQSMSGMLAVINATESDINKLADATTNYDGAASDMASTMQGGTQGALDKIKSTFETIGITLSETLLPILNKFLDKVQELADKFNALSPEQQEQIVKILAIAAALGPLLMIIGQVITIVGAIQAMFAVLGPILAGISAPILIIVAAIGLLIAAFVYLFNNNEQFRTSVLAMWEQIKQAFQAAVTFIKALIYWLGEIITNAWNSNFMNIQGIVASGWELIKSYFQFAIDLITGIFSVFTSLLQGDWQGAITKLLNLTNKLRTQLVNIIKNMLNFVLNIFGTNLTELTSKIQEKIDSIKEIFENLKEKIRDIMDGIMEVWRSFKLPTFTLRTRTKMVLGKEITFPTGFNINWHADGGIFTRPTVLGGHGFGEKGKEAILPLNRLPGLLGLDKQSNNHVVIYLDGEKIYDGIDTFLGEKVLGGV